MPHDVEQTVATFHVANGSQEGALRVPKEPSRTRNTAAMKNIVNDYAIVFHYIPPPTYLYSRGRSACEPRKRVLAQGARDSKS